MIQEDSKDVIDSKIAFKTLELQEIHNNLKQGKQLKKKEMVLRKDSDSTVYEIVNHYTLPMLSQNVYDGNKQDQMVKNYTNALCKTVCIQFTDLSTLLILNLRYSYNLSQYQSNGLSSVINAISYRNSDSLRDLHFFTIDLYKTESKTLDFRAFLNSYLKYYNHVLTELELNKNILSMEIHLSLFKSNIEFLDIGSDEGTLIIPIIGKTLPIRSIAIETEDYKGKRNTTSIRDVSSGALDKEESAKYITSLNEMGIQLPKDVSLCVLTLNEVYTDRTTILSTLLNPKAVKCRICEDTIGDKVRVKRVISSINKILTDKCVNPELANIICCNDLETFYSNCKVNFESDDQFSTYLASKYPSLKNNKEQSIAVEKIVNMSKNNIPLMLVQGPPGTGKTELILALTKELSNTGKNVLITSNVHVACDNVIERSKNNKELIFKRYTSLNNPEKYDLEIYQNQKRYFLNQVLPGFKYKNEVISSTKDMSKIINESAKLMSEIKQMESKYASQSKLFENYFSLINGLDGQNKKIEESDVQIIDLEQKIGVITQELVSHKNDFEILEISFEELTDVMSELNKKMENITLQKQSLEKSIDINKTTTLKKREEKAALLESISTSDQILEDLNDRLSVQQTELETIMSIDINNERATFIKKMENKSTFSSLLYTYFNFEMQLVDKYRKTRELLSKDLDFWNSNYLSKKLIADLWFNKNNLYLETMTFNSNRSLEILYEYSKYSKFKKFIFNLFKSARNDFTKNEVVSSEKELLQYFKEMQYDYKIILEKLFNNQFPKDKLLSLETDNLKKIEKLEVDISYHNSLILSHKQRINVLDNEIQELSEDIIILKNKLSDTIKTSTACTQDKIDKNSLLEKTTRSIFDKKAIIHESQIKLNDLNNNLNNWYLSKERFLRELQSMENQIELEKSIHGSKLSEFISFQKKYNVELRNKKIEHDKIDGFINSFNYKSDLLKTHNGIDANSVLFDYAKEVALLDDRDDDDLKTAFNGKGNVFKSSFKIEDNENGSLISMTTSQVAQLLDRDSSFFFDYAIIDESSKCKLEDIIISLPRVKHLVLIGDYMQLDPLLDDFNDLSEEKKNLIEDEQKWLQLNKSPFSMLLDQIVKFNERNEINSYDANPMVSVLKRQFRMNKGIYNLVAPIYSIHKGFEIIDEKNTEASDLKCIDIKGQDEKINYSYKNVDEINFTVKMLLDIEKNRHLYPHIKSIGVITGYKKQSNEIRKALNLKIDKKIKGLEIGTIDNFQGREYDLVILSIVRTSGLGFLREVRRMNVAISRAKNHLIILGNFDKIHSVSEKEKRDRKAELAYISQQNEEHKFVLSKLIPCLHSLKESHLSDEHRISDVQKLLMENSYE